MILKYRNFSFSNYDWIQFSFQTFSRYLLHTIYTNNFDSFRHACSNESEIEKNIYFESYLIEPSYFGPVVRKPMVAKQRCVPTHFSRIRFPFFIPFMSRVLLFWLKTEDSENSSQSTPPSPPLPPDSYLRKNGIFFIMLFSLFIPPFLM